MLGLVSTTDPRWIDVALGDLDAVLLDHLHCELKAASHATAMVTRYPMHARLARELTALAAEELGHVAQVFEALARRGVAPTPPPEDAYARALQRALADRKSEPLLDRLAVAAVIEARSCERFGLLAAHAPDEAMRAWYRELFASEARHHRLFASLAEEIFGEERARERIGLLVVREAEILAASALAPRVH